jgi:tRNA threonylcarbamoyl adenosine modification protein YjeE
MGIERVFLKDDEATAGLGARLARTLGPGDTVLLIGGLGAGKTSLARAVIRTLAGDADMDVPSPTYALVQPYISASGTQILHADLYRISDPREVDELGLFDRSDAIVLIEWPEKAHELLPGSVTSVTLSVPETRMGRVAEIAR